MQYNLREDPVLSPLVESQVHMWFHRQVHLYVIERLFLLLPGHLAITNKSILTFSEASS